MRKLQIAIDGPASSGKSTVAKIVAKDMGYIYCDTGAMYRVVTYEALKEKIRLDDNRTLKEMLEKLNFNFLLDNSGQRVISNGKDVTDLIRLPEVSNNVSLVSAQPSVRDVLTKRQQKMAHDGGIVMDGRDIGTTVLPNAQVKIYLVASAEQRALRRYEENLKKNVMTPFEKLKKEILERDYKDANRKLSPLRKASDAFEIDTTNLNIEEVVTKIEKIILKKEKNNNLE